MVIFSGRKQGFKGAEPYLEELKSKGKIDNPRTMLESYPNSNLWNEMTEFIREKYPEDKFAFGFTRLPRELIFRDKAVLFEHAIVVLQEMKKDKIDQAPEVAAGEEVMRVYASLGNVVNDLASQLRNKDIKALSNHPIGGLVCTPPLAGKAGLGWIGRNGLLITPKFGSRVRIAPVFIQNKIFEYTDSKTHRWVEKFCASCGKCQRACPMGAIYEKKEVGMKDLDGIGHTRTCIDREKCFPQFNKTLGCSICIKVCPFSHGKETYSKLKESFGE